MGNRMNPALLNCSRQHLCIDAVCLAAVMADSDLAVLVVSTSRTSCPIASTRRERATLRDTPRSLPSLALSLGPSRSAWLFSSQTVRRATTRRRRTSQKDVSLTPRSKATLRMAVSSLIPGACVLERVGLTRVSSRIEEWPLSSTSPLDVAYPWCPTAPMFLIHRQPHPIWYDSRALRRQHRRRTSRLRAARHRRHLPRGRRPRAGVPRVGFERPGTHRDAFGLTLEAMRQPPSRNARCPRTIPPRRASRRR